VVQIHPDPPFRAARRYGTTRLLLINFAVPCLDQHKMVGDATSIGAIAQMGERLICIQEVGGSIPPGSTIVGRWNWLLHKF
jgi:hypothetical protein